MTHKAGMTATDAFDVIASELAPLKGASVLDIGCGRAAPLRGPLEAAGALWRGLDPAGGPEDQRIDKTPAEAMPYADAGFDAAICVNALHHVPVPAMATALSEAARVLRPGGRLVVIEPRAAGALSQVLAVIDDETRVRAAAQRAMDTTSALEELRAWDYPRSECYGSFGAFCDSLSAVSPDRASAIAEHTGRLRQSFETLARHDGAGWHLSQPMSVRVFGRG